MRLISLQIKRMPGFKEKGFTYSEGILKPGINLIVGSNGAGKTTTCLAVRKLFFPLHPSVRELAPLSLEALVEQEGNFIQLEIEGSRVKSIPQIQWPERHDAICYTLLLEDLFDATETNFAHELSKMVFGGCDLERLREQFFLPPRFGHKECKQLYEKSRAVQRIALDYKELQDQEESLEQLSSQVQEAKQSKEILEKIQIARELLQKKAVLQEVEKALLELLPGAAFIRDEDVRIYEEIKKCEKEYIQEKVLDDLAFFSLEEAVKELQELDRELREEKRRTAELQTDIRERCSLLEVEKGKFPCIQISKVAEMQKLWEKWHEKMCAVKESETRLKILESDNEPTYSTEILREGIRLLDAFVKEEDQKWLRILLLCTPLLSLFLHRHPYLCGGILLFSCVVLYLLRHSSSNSYKRAFLKLGLPIPLEWTVEEVNQHRSRLETMWGETIRILNDKETAQIIGIQRNMYKEEADSLYQDLHAAGFDHSKLLWIPFLHGLQRAQDLFFEMKKQEAKVFDAEQRKQDLLKEYRVENTQEAILLFTQAKKSREKARELKIIKARKEEILLRAKINVKDEEEEKKFLIKALEQHSLFLRYTQEKAVLESAIQEKKARLVSYEYLEELPLHEVEALEEQLKKKAAVHDLLLQQIAAIQQKIESAGQRDAFAKADAEEKEAEQTLKKLKNEFIHKTLGSFLLEKAEQLYTRNFQPEVLKKAMMWFLRFTRGVYNLQFVQKKGFVALDQRTQEMHQIEELSRGTRIQLVLAIRLAFMENTEKEGAKFPLLLDEVMGHADDERFCYMASALEEVAESGRQIFYFTCQKGSLELWQKAVSEPSQLNVIDLDKLKQENACQIAPLKEKEEETGLPSPTGKNLFTYAQELQIPGINKEEDPFAWHIGHFVSSAEELHQLILQKIHFYGQFKNLLETGLAKSVKIAAKGKLAEHYYALVQRGRGKKLTCEDLEKAGVTYKFLDKVLDCAKQNDYDAKKLLHALENKQVPGFREKAREDLQTYFIESGRLDLREPLNTVSLRAHLWNYFNEAASTCLSQEEAASFINKLLA